MTNSTRQSASRKPNTEVVKYRSSAKKLGGAKLKNFALSIHKGTGYWCRKVRGRVYYFGRVADDPKGQAALHQWLEQKDDLLAGREPRVRKSDEVSVAAICNEYLTHQEGRCEAGEISPRTFWQLHATCATICDVLGKQRVVSDLMPADFGKLKDKLQKTRGATSLGNEMQRCRSVFLFAYRQQLILKEVQYGMKFDKPARKLVRRAKRLHREQHGDKMFEAAEIQQLLATASQPLKTMILLAINGGFGQSDLSGMPLSVVDLKKAVINYPRPKTEADRVVPLWPETVAALREWIPQRPPAKDHADAGLLFLTCFGTRFVKTGSKGASIDGVGQEFRKVLAKLKLQRAGRSFYGLRHSFRTVADETLDASATDLIMGHTDNSMAGHYRERIGEDRLRRVVDHVRAWLLGT